MEALSTVRQHRWQLRMLVPWFSFLEPTSSSQPSAVWREFTREKIKGYESWREAVKLVVSDERTHRTEN